MENMYLDRAKSLRSQDTAYIWWGESGEAWNGYLKKMAHSISLYGCVEFLGIFCIIIVSKLFSYKIYTQKGRNKNTDQ